MGSFLKGLKFVHDNKDLIKTFLIQKIKIYVCIGLAVIIGMCLLAGAVMVIFDNLQDKVAQVAKSVSKICSIQTTSDGKSFCCIGTSDMQKLENTLKSMGIDTKAMGLDLKSDHIKKYLKAELTTSLPKILADDDKADVQKYLDEYNKTQKDEEGELPEEKDSTDKKNSTDSKETKVDDVKDGVTQMPEHENDGYTSVLKVGNRVYLEYKQYVGYYADSHYWDGPMSKEACGPTSVAICLSGYGKTIDPRQVIDQTGLTMSSPESLSAALKKLEMENTVVYNGYSGQDTYDISQDKEIIEKQLKDGKPIMLSLQGPSKFTAGGHYICLFGENSDGSLIVSDPGHNADRCAENMLGETLDSMLQSYINAYILLESDSVDTTGISGSAKMEGKQDLIDGIVTIVRKDESGNTKDLKFLGSKEFNEKITKSDDDVLNYFTVDSNWTMYVATATDTYKNGSLESHKLSKHPIAYKDAVSKYSMPVEFLVALCVVTENPNWADALADIALKDTTLQVVVQDSHRTTETTVTVTKEIEVHEKVTYHETNPDTKESEEHEKMETTTKTETETTVTKVVAGNIVAYLGKIDTWCAKGSLEYIKKDIEKSSSSSSSEDKSKEEDPLDDDEEGSRVKSYKVDTTINTETQGYKKGDSKVEVTPDKFLGTLKNKTGKHEIGATYDKDGIKVLYTDLSGYAREPIDNILSTPDWLFNMIEKSERCQNQEMVLKYFLYLYTGRDFGVKEIDSSIFGIDDLKSSSGSGAKGGDVFDRFMRNWEEDVLMQYLDGDISFSSRVGACCSEDKTQFVSEDDGGNNPTVGFGICLKFNGKRFEKYGISGAASFGMGVSIPADICMKVYYDELNDDHEAVLAEVDGLGLNEQQIDALTAICYQYGNVRGFADAYRKYGNTEELRSGFTLSCYTPFLHGYEQDGKREEANWKLFHEGIYIDQQGNEVVGTSDSSGASGTVAEAAKKCHNILEERNAAGKGSPTYVYYGGGANIPFTEDQHNIDCSGFVSWVMYESGHTEFEGGQKDSNYFLNNTCGFEDVNASDIQPGDILVYSNHVEIYGGDNNGWMQVYNCGTQDAIGQPSPKNAGHKSPSDASRILRAN